MADKDRQTLFEGYENPPPPPYSPAQSHGEQPGIGMHNPYAMPNYTTQGAFTNPGYQQGQLAGHQMISNTVVVSSVGGGNGVPIYQTAPPDYTTQAWVACMCCFWPTGILAILKASESREALARGDIVGAQSAANSALLMVRISFCVGIVGIFAMLLVVVLMVTLL